MRSLVTWLLVLASGIAARAADSASPASLDHLLPADTFFYAAFDTRALRDGLSELDAAGLVREPEMKRFLKPLLKRLPDGGGEDPVKALLALADLDSWIKGEVAVGITGLSIETRGADGKWTRHRLSPANPFDARFFNDMLGATIDMGTIGGVDAAKPEAPRFALEFLLSAEPGPALRGIVQEQLRHLPWGRVETETISGREITRITVEAPNGMSTALYADLSGERWLVSGSKEGLAAALGGARAGSLADAESYTRVRHRIATGRNVAFGYLDVAGLLSIGSRLVAPVVMDEVKILGLDQLTGAALAMGFVEGSVRESFLVASEGQAHGLCKLFETLGQGFPSLASAPASTVAFAGLRLDLDRFRHGLLEVAQEVLPGSVDALQRAMHQLVVKGVSVMDTILPSIGDELSVAVSPSARSFIPDVILQLAIRDTQKFQQVLDLAREQLAQMVTITSFPIPGGSDGFVVRGPEPEVQPAFAVRGNRLYGAVLGPLPLKTYLASHVQNPNLETLGKTSEILPKVMRGLTGGQVEPGVLVYLDLRHSLPVIYQSLSPFLPQMLQESGSGLDASLLPIAETIAPHFSGLALGVTRGPEGISLDAFTPLGLTPLAIIAGLAEHHLKHQPFPPQPAKASRRAASAEDLR